MNLLEYVPDSIRRRLTAKRKSSPNSVPVRG